MSTSTFESNIKQIPHKQESVYRTLSDLNNLQMLKDRFEQVKDQIPEDNRKQPRSFQLLDSAAPYRRVLMQNETHHQGRT